LALTHGAKGLQYFVHIFSPTFIEAGLLQDATMYNAVKAINLQVKSLATILNSPTVANGASVTAGFRVDKMVKRSGADTYVFAVTPSSTGGNASFTVPGMTSGTVTVIDEGRTLTLSGGSFSDSFVGYGVHLYKISAGSPPSAKPGDVNGDSQVDVFDLSILLSHFGQTGQSRSTGDLNGDGSVSVIDLSVLLSNFGK
jgi:hypothetical protein